jgi:hypothetical protein
LPGVIRWLRRNLDRRSAWILLGLVVLALLLDFLFFTGFYASDDIQYIDSAVSVARDGVMPPGFGNTRLGVALPGAFVLWVTGGSLTAMVWSYVGYHLALVPIAYVLARLLFDERAGLIAAALVAINPLLYGFAGAVLPDNAATCCFGLSMIALVATRRYADPGTGLMSWSKRRFLGYFVAGAMVGFCYWCKESALILTIPAAVFIIAAGPSVRSLVWIQNGAIFTLGLVVVFVLELVVLKTLTGQWINRLTYLSDAAHELRATMEVQGATPFARLGYASEHLTRWMPLSTWLLVAGAVAYGFTRARDVGMMVFCWFPAIYMTLGSTSFSEYLPPPIQGRYYALVILPAAVMTAIGTSILIERWRARRPRAYTRLALVSTLLLVGVYECGTAFPMSGTLYRARDVRAFVAAIERADNLFPDMPIVVSPFYWRMGPLLRDRDDITIEDPRNARPEPPYLYIRRATNPELSDPDPVVPATQEIESIQLLTPPRNRWQVLADAFQRIGGAKLRQRASRMKREWSAELLLVRAKPTPPNPN